LPRLSAHFSTAVLSFLGFEAVQWVISPLLFGRLFPVAYGKASKRVKQGWANRACSTVHAVIVVILAARCLNLEEINRDKIYGMHPREGEVEAFAIGYFIWDVLEEAVIHYQDPMLAFHGVAVLSGLLLTLRPLFAYTCLRFLMWELSTPFLNIHWFIDKTGHTGTTLQLINGCFLISTFFLSRICFGSVTAFKFISAVYAEQRNIPTFLAWYYTVCTVTLVCFNCFWLCKMFTAIKKRFNAPEKKSN